MTGLLTHMTTDFDRRLKLRRQMLDRMGIVPKQDLGTTLIEASRDTLRCCTECRTTEACEVWFDRGAPGDPGFCGGQRAFDRLSDAINPDIRAAREEARSEDQAPRRERRASR
ncbi:hypothetical protein JQU17_09725 [Ponticoccus sp. SC2-23]|uniref:DUF6455 family protein n=1 Tax=Alexandriicola marinus TaxID=2081710 RepID=UPI000FD8F099|nr:DUF6455 family protein [Alexandriicola marinus]MBM1220032.1 hypothetical protein [Ponticoccus sp. SC6-9]MBM1224718.1 hypothetical protein [Ponticoccus sp. SC6-15]MBM1228231.1 hypothetical protein [Ponticoccus sp. SC6-38]MBM1234131.1 hypothetical protein [Ponticoccus sp. SC6-45]MBM1238733.1 hypothetical protein [Ponticoccus sp. SC6-49]MBM1242514.1 hypothetical protein [Ponticoccus sp. SC2-64]MBM1247655.1 hypothetical protein [Ponticoccus sp. SC6-42]MBM1251686.1 hypothetical protein [Ponti